MIYSSIAELSKRIKSKRTNYYHRHSAWIDQKNNFFLAHEHFRHGLFGMWLLTTLKAARRIANEWGNGNANKDAMKLIECIWFHPQRRCKVHLSKKKQLNKWTVSIFRSLRPHEWARFSICQSTEDYVRVFKSTKGTQIGLKLSAVEIRDEMDKA